MPSQRMKSGTQASDGIERRACTVGSSSRRALIDQPVKPPSSRPTVAPSKNPDTTRHTVAVAWLNNSPVLASAQSVPATLLGGGSSRASTRPARNAPS